MRATTAETTVYRPSAKLRLLVTSCYDAFLCHGSKIKNSSNHRAAAHGSSLGFWCQTVPQLTPSPLHVELPVTELLPRRCLTWEHSSRESNGSQTRFVTRTCALVRTVTRTQEAWFRHMHMGRCTAVQAVRSRAHQAHELLQAADRHSRKARTAWPRLKRPHLQDTLATLPKVRHCAEGGYSYRHLTHAPRRTAARSTSTAAPIPSGSKCHMPACGRTPASVNATHVTPASKLAKPIRRPQKENQSAN